MKGTEFRLASVLIFSNSGCKISFWFFREIFVGDFGLASVLETLLSGSEVAVLEPGSCWGCERAATVGGWCR